MTAAPKTEQRMLRIMKRFPDYRSDDRFGPCPLEYDWQHRNIVGIRTGDEERARRWVIDALLLGYSPFYCFSAHGNGAGTKTIKHWQMNKSLTDLFSVRPLPGNRWGPGGDSKNPMLARTATGSAIFLS
jgi:hypothetical protein